MALETYTTGLRALCDERVRNALSRFVRSVLLNTFEIERYDTTKNPHLERIQRFDRDNNTNVLENWKNFTFENTVTPIEGSTGNVAFSFEDFFKQKLADSHGHKNGEEQLPRLSSFLMALPEERSRIKNELIQTIKDKNEEKLQAAGNEVERTQALNMYQAQLSCMELIDNSSLTKTAQIELLEALSDQLSSLELGNDLKGLAGSLKAPQKSPSKEKVELCKGWEDLFLSGIEVAGSCQRIDGNASLNRCLLAYCLDGKNAMVAVKNEGGKILARSMLRLLWDNKGSKPVLFLDRLYPSPCPKEREEAIKKGAIECAKRLGLELFTGWPSGIPSPGKTLASLGSSCPYEYADGAEGVMPEGRFAIQRVNRIENP